MERTGKVARPLVVAFGLVLTCLPAPAGAQRALTAEQEAWVPESYVLLNAKQLDPGGSARDDRRRSDAVGAQMVGGIVAGLAGAGLVTGGLLLSMVGQPDDGWGRLTAIGIGTLVGYPLGAAGGVYWAGRAKGFRGSVLGTLAGTAAGAVAGALLADRTDGISFVVVIPAGAIAGFHLIDVLRDGSE